MISAGNDIVALALVNKQRTLQFSFYSKILSVSEQALYRQPEIEQIPFENYVWLLWSVKESVYKYLKRNTPAQVFSPTKIIIQHIEIPGVLNTSSQDAQFDGSDSPEDFYRGVVNDGPDTFYFRSKISESWIATVVNDEECFEDIFWGVKSISSVDYKTQSEGARLALINKLTSVYPGDLQIAKSLVGYPIIINNNAETDLPASLAHDGYFVAYSVVLSSESASA